MQIPQDITKTKIVVDTDVVSYVFKQHELANFFMPYFQNRTLAVSFMTVAQLYYGAYKANWGTNQLSRLDNHLKNYVVFPYSYEICLKWAQVKKLCESSGYSIEHSDCWIASSALLYDCALATNNRKHFMYIKNLELISPNLL